jgi:hypothetical protein
MEVNKNSTIKLHLVPSGGAAISLIVRE